MATNKVTKRKATPAARTAKAAAPAKRSSAKKTAPGKKAAAKTKAPEKTRAAKRAPEKKSTATRAPEKRTRGAEPRLAHVRKPTPKRADPARVEDHLARAVPEPLCELKFESPFQLLISTILAAQSTDRTVNSVAPALYGRWPNAAALAAASQEDVELVVKATGFFRVKAKAIRDTAALLVERHGGDVPRTMEELVALKGVARKTANVVLGTAYKLNFGFVVDTHVSRVSQRLGLTQYEDPVKIERDLCAVFAQSGWSEMAHRLTLHGRHTCLARKPMCTECPLNELCPSREAEAQQDVADRERQEAERVRRQLVITGVLADVFAPGEAPAPLSTMSGQLPS